MRETDPSAPPGQATRAGRDGRSGNEPPRRGPGELAAAVMQVLWEAGRPLSPAEVQAALAARDEETSGLSYSTVVTILSRFVAELSDHDEQLLRSLLSDSGPGGS
jgi:hypothetical protein